MRYHDAAVQVIGETTLGVVDAAIEKMSLAGKGTKEVHHDVALTSGLESQGEV